MIEFANMGKEEAKIFMTNGHDKQPVREVMAEMCGTGKVLDLGCGKGIKIKDLFTPEQYLGLDCSKELIKLAQEDNPGYNFKTWDINKLPFLQDKSFDFVLIKSVLEHTPNVESAKQILREACRVGKTVLVAWHTPPIYDETQLISVKAELDRPIFQNHYAEDEFNEWFPRDMLGVENFELWIIKDC